MKPKKSHTQKWNDRFYADSSLNSSSTTSFQHSVYSSASNKTRPKSGTSSRPSTAKKSNIVFRNTLKRIHEAKYGLEQSDERESRRKRGNRLNESVKSLKLTKRLKATVKRSNRVRQDRAYNKGLDLIDEVQREWEEIQRSKQEERMRRDRALLSSLTQSSNRSQHPASSRMSIYQFEQLKERITKLWHALKFSQVDREQFSRFFFSIRYAPILEDHYRNLLRFKDRTLDVLKLIQIRESKLQRIVSLVEQSYRGGGGPLLDSREMRIHVATLVGELRSSSLEIVDAIQRWRTECLTHPKPYIWNSTNYLLKMETDMGFFLPSPLAAYIPDLFLSTKLKDTHDDFSTQDETGDDKHSASKVQIVPKSCPSLPPLEWIEEEAQRRDKVQELLPVIEHIRAARDVILNETRMNEVNLQRHTREAQEKRFTPSLASSLNSFILSELERLERMREEVNGEDSREELEENSLDEEEDDSAADADNVTDALDILDREVSKINESLELGEADIHSKQSHSAQQHSQFAIDPNHNGILDLTPQQDTPFGNFFTSPDRPATSLGFSRRAHSARFGSPSSPTLTEQRPKTSFAFQPPSHDEAMRLIDNAIEAKKEHNRRRSEKINRERISATSVSQTFKLLMSKNGSANRIHPNI